MKLWKVTVNNFGWNSAKTLYAESKEAAASLAAKYPAADRISYAGNFSDAKAKVMLATTLISTTNVSSPDFVMTAELAEAYRLING